MREEFYLDERRRKKHRLILKLKIFGGVAAFFILIIGTVYLIVYSPLFQIKEINISTSDVDNLTTLDVEKLINDFKNYFVGRSKIVSFLGSNNILIWQKRGIDEILKNYPQIAELKIEKDYFKRQVKITIQKREKFGIWCVNQFRITQPPGPDGQSLEDQTSQILCFWFDKNGVIFSEAPIVRGNLINKVDDFSGRSLKLGEVALEEKLLVNLIKIFAVLEKSSLGIKPLTLKRLELQEISAESSPPIYFSLRFDPQFALTAFDVLKKIGLEKIEYIDLRVNNRAYYKLK